MHKVRGNYGSGTRGAAKMHPTSVEASGKGEDSVAVKSHLILYFLQAPFTSQGRLNVRTHYTVVLGFRVYALSYYLTPKAPPSLS